MKKTLVVRSDFSHRRMRNLGILFVLIGLFLLMFTFGYYIFNNTDQDILHLDVRENPKNIILFWEPQKKKIFVKANERLTTKLCVSL